MLRETDQLSPEDVEVESRSESTRSLPGRSLSQAGLQHTQQHFRLLKLCEFFLFVVGQSDAALFREEFCKATLDFIGRSISQNRITIRASCQQVRDLIQINHSVLNC